MTRFIRLSAITRAGRHGVIDAASGAILASGGWLLDSRLYSNLSAVLLFQLPSDRVPAVGAALLSAGIPLDTDSRTALAAWPPDADPAAETTGTLELTFVHDEPDLRRRLPMVPG